MTRLQSDIEERVRELLASLPRKDGALIPLLQQVQSIEGYISPEAVRTIARELKISESLVYGVATFYSEFKLEKPGRHNLKICLGTSCYLRGGQALLDHLSRCLGVEPGQTTRDGKFSLDTVACLGCCSRSPAMSIDGVIYGVLTSDQTDSLIANMD